MSSDDRALLSYGRRLDTLEEWRRRHAPHEIGPTLGEYASTFRALPAIRGLWYAGDADNTGAVYDHTHQGRTLTYNGNPAIALYNDAIPYYDLDGTGDYLSRPDEAGLDILGTETYVASAIRGLTVGGWFWADAIGGLDGFIGKYNSVGNQRGWIIQVDVGGTSFNSVLSVDGTATHNVTSAAITLGQWYFLVLRFTPGVEHALFVNGTEYVNTTSVPASIFNNTAALEIGRRSAAGTELDGRFAMAFACAAALPDTLLRLMLNRTRVFFQI